MKTLSYIVYTALFLTIAVIACKKINQDTSTTNTTSVQDAFKRKIKVMSDPCTGATETVGVYYTDNETTAGSCTTWSLTRHEAKKCVETGDVSLENMVVMKSRNGTCSNMPQDVNYGLPPIDFPSSLFSDTSTHNYTPGIGFTLQGIFNYNSTYFNSHFVNLKITEDMYYYIDNAMWTLLDQDEVSPYDSQGMEKIKYATLGAMMTYQLGSTDPTSWATNYPFSSAAADVKYAYTQGIAYASNNSFESVSAIFLFFKYKVQSHQI